MVKIPATKPGLAAIEDVIAKGRSINVTLIFSLQPLRGGRRVLRARARAARRRGRGPGQGRIGGELLRLADRHRGRQTPAGGRRPRRRSRASWRSPTRSSPTPTTSRSSRARAGSTWRARARPPSACCGRRPRRRTRRIWTRSTSRSCSARTPSTRSRRTRSRPTRITATRSRGCRAAWPRRIRCSRISSGAGVDYDDVTDTLEREGVEKFEAAFAELLETLERQTGVAGAGLSAAAAQGAARGSRARARSAVPQLRSRGSGRARGSPAVPDGNAVAWTVNTRKLCPRYW